MLGFEEVSWEEIYKYWNRYREYTPRILQQPITPVEMQINYNRNRQREIFYGYDWLTRNEYEVRKETIENDVVQFLLFSKPTNKGTIHTLNMLVNALDDEERAAIWIYAFAKEMDDREHRGNIHRYAYQLCYAAQNYLSSRFYMWHHAMRRLIPEIYINRSVYSDTEFSSINAVIELARINAALVLHECVPILYTSLKPGEEAPDISERRR